MDRAPFAARVADLIERRADRTSVVIGVYGPWGEGKTTVLNFVAKQLEPKLDGKPDLVVVNFNPWLVRDEYSLLTAFFETLAEAVDQRLEGLGVKAGNLLRDYGGVVSGVTFGPPGINFDPGKAMQGLGDALSNQSLEKKRKQFEKALAKAGKRIVVILDDLDRLDDAEVHAVFKLVKLAAAFDGVTYVLAFDDAKIAASLQLRFGGGVEGSGHDFLEKIVQVPLHLPAARREALDDLTLQGLDGVLGELEIELTDEQAVEFKLRYEKALAPRITSVRAAKRFINTASFALPLLRGEANPVDVLTVEGIHTIYAALYQAMREHPDWFLLPRPMLGGHDDKALTEAQRNRIEAVVGRDEPNAPERLIWLVREMFPQTERLWSNILSSGSDAAEEQRIASTEYYNRYFSYGLSSRREVGDTEVARLLDDPGAAAGEIIRVIDERGEVILGSLLPRLQRRVTAGGSPLNQAIRAAMLELGTRISKGEAPSLLRHTPERDAAAVIAVTLAAISNRTARLRAAADVIEAASPVGFALECLMMMRLRLSAEDDTRVASEQDIKRLARRLAQRIADAASKTRRPYWIAETRGASLLATAAYHGQRPAVRAHVREWFDRDPKNVLPLLRGYGGTAYGGKFGRPHQSDLDMDGYVRMDALASAADVRRALRALGHSRAPRQYPRLWEHPDEDRNDVLCRQYLYLDRKRRADKNASRAATSATAATE